MRIIITKKGSAEFKVFESSPKQQSRNKSTTEIRASKSQREIWNKSTKYLSKTNTSFPKIQQTYVDINETKITKFQLKKANKIVLKNSNLKLSNAMLVRYEKMPKGKEELKTDIKQKDTQTIPVELAKKTINNSQKLQLKQIIIPRAIRAMQQHIIEEEEDHKTNRKITQEDFRTVYDNGVTKLNVFNQMLNKEINGDKTNLIHYFKRKNSVSPLSIQRISNSNNDQIIKMNRVCQIIFQNQDKRENDQKKITDKLFFREHKLKLSYSDSMKKITNGIKETKDILCKYTNKKSNISQYKEMINDMKKRYWTKYNVDNIYNKTSQKNQTQDIDDPKQIIKP